MKLLTDGKSNTKTAKNIMPTYYLSLQPTNLNSKGVNLCKFSTDACRNACLQYAGRQSFNNVVISRSKKTEFFVNETKEFVAQLWSEIEELNKKFDGKKAAIRLNLLSDVDWEDQFNKHLDKVADVNKLTNIQLYDYTKDPFKVLNNTWKNYSLTFSYSGGNWQYAEKFLKSKVCNVAVVFKGGLPLTWNGFDVINGDESDERYLDEKGKIIGLKYKVARGRIYKPDKFIVEI